jgi:hypothetical protein
MSYKRFHGSRGPIYLERPQTTVQQAANEIKQMIAILGIAEDVLITARFTEQECQELLRQFPSYKRCFQESGNLVMLD